MYAFLAVIEICHLAIVYCGRWLILCASGLNSNATSLKKDVVCLGLDLHPTIQQGDQNLPKGHIVPGAFSAEDISPCIHGMGNIAGTTSAGSSSTVFPSLENIS